MASFDRSYTTAYQSPIIALSFAFFKTVDVKQYCDLEICVRGHSNANFCKICASLTSTDQSFCRWFYGSIFIHFYIASIRR